MAEWRQVIDSERTGRRLVVVRDRFVGKVVYLHGALGATIEVRPANQSFEEYKRTRPTKYRVVDTHDHEILERAVNELLDSVEVRVPPRKSRKRQVTYT